MFSIPNFLNQNFEEKVVIDNLQTSRKARPPGGATDAVSGYAKIVRKAHLSVIRRRLSI